MPERWKAESGRGYECLRQISDDLFDEIGGKY